MRLAEMERAAQLTHREQRWVHIVRLLLNRKPPRRRGGRKRNRRSLQLSESQSFSDYDYIANEVAAFLSAPEEPSQDASRVCLSSDEVFFVEVGDNAHDPDFVG